MPSTAVVTVAGRRPKRAFGRWIGGLVADQLVATLGRHAVARVVGGTTPAVRALIVTSQHTAGHIGQSQVLDGSHRYVLISVGCSCIRTPRNESVYNVTAKRKGGDLK